MWYTICNKVDGYYNIITNITESSNIEDTQSEQCKVSYITSNSSFTTFYVTYVI